MFMIGVHACAGAVCLSQKCASGMNWTFLDHLPCTDSVLFHEESPRWGVWIVTASSDIPIS